MTAVSASNAIAKPYFAWVDNAKAILIFLVVFGHFNYYYIPVPAKNVIYAFHVPAFLFVTGFLLPVDFDQLGFKVVLKRWIALYARAYVFFSIVAIILWWGSTLYWLDRVADPVPAILGAAYGVGGDDQLLVHRDGPLWYFPFLVSSLAGVALIARFPALIGWGLVALWAAFSVLWSGPRLPWAVDIAGMGAVALFSGLKFRRFWPRFAPLLERRLSAAAIALAAAALLYVCSRLNGFANVNQAAFGRNGLLYVVSMMAGTMMVVAVGAFLPETKLARAISAATLTTFALHIYVVRIVGKSLPDDFSRDVRVIFMILAAAAIVLAFVVVSRLLAPVLNRVVFLRGS